jgi:predicted nucleic acid-binding protein
VDTTFLIDLQRERSAGTDGPAHALLLDDPEVELFLPVTALGEFAEGFEDPDHPVMRAVRELHTLLPIDEETALTYGRLTRELRSTGRLIGTNDLWIAASAVRNGLPLVTADVGAFRRVPDLEVLAYRG